MTVPFVYFIRPRGMEGPVKIGYSTTPLQRLETFAAWSPYPLEIAATYPGSFDLEQKLHAYFAISHSHREWFHGNRVLTKLIDDLSRGIPLHDAIDLSGHAGSVPTRIARKRRSADFCKCRSYTARIENAVRRLNKNKNETGIDFYLPDDISTILREWLGSSYLNIIGIPPSEERIARLDDFLKDIEGGCHQRPYVPYFPRPAATSGALQ